MALQTRAHDKDDVLTILITGFGPFMEQFPVNPSFEIVRRLPHQLPGCDTRKPVRIITYPTAVKVAFDVVRELIPRMHDEFAGTVDVVIHIGMASGRKYYTLERYAHRDGYGKYKDVDGQTPPDDQGETLFADCPERMATSLAYEDILAGWQAGVAAIPKREAGHGADVQRSEDAGHFLCDYSYFQSLAYFARRSGCYEGGNDDDRPVLFLHVPGESDDETLAKGGAVTISLLHAIAEAYTKPAVPNGVH